jgi:hypothetical protein
MARKELPEGTVLLDVTDVSYASFAQNFLEKTGHQALVCHGPTEGPCPLLTGAGCEKIDAAHGVVFQFDLDRPEHRSILARYKKVLDPEIPIRVVVEHGQDEVFAELLTGTDVWAREPTAGDLDAFAAEVEAADQSRDIDQ